MLIVQFLSAKKQVALNQFWQILKQRMFYPILKINLYD